MRNFSLIRHVIFSLALLPCATLAERFMGPPETPLVAAVKEGRAEDVQDMLSSYGVNDDDRCHEGKSLASYAAERGDVNILRILLEAGFKVDGAQCRGDSPLYEAAEQGHVDAVRYLLSHGADVKFHVGNGSTPLIAAIQGPFFAAGPEGDRRATVRVLLEAGADSNVENQFGQTPLILAVLHADGRLARTLLAHQADPLEKNKDGVSALEMARQRGLDYLVALLEGNDPYQPSAAARNLIEAVKSGKLDAVRKLLADGADVNARDDDGNSALIYAAFLGYEGIAGALLGRGADAGVRNAANDTALHYAAAKGTARLVEALLERGVDTRVKDSSGNTALAYAVRGGRVAAAELLLTHGAGANEKDKDGVTLLMEASVNGDEAMVRTLCRGGAAIDTADQDGRTALMLAAREGKLGVVQVLLEHGADHRKENNDRSAPLHFAMEGRHLGIVRILMQKGARPDRRVLLSALRGEDTEAVDLILGSGVPPDADPGEEVPLLSAAGSYQNKLALTKMLVEAGARVNVADEEGRTPLMEASRWSGEDSLRTVEYLLSAGADPAARDKKGMSAWTYAMLTGHNAAASAIKAAGASADYDSLEWEGSFTEGIGRSAFAVTDQRSWAEMWKRLGRDSEAPAIDFEHNVVACVFLGEIPGPESASIRFKTPSIGNGVLMIGYTVHESFIYDVFSTSPYGVKVFKREGAREVAVQAPPEDLFSLHGAPGPRPGEWPEMIRRE